MSLRSSLTGIALVAFAATTSSVPALTQDPPPAEHPRDLLIPSLPPFAPALPRRVEMERGPAMFVMADRGTRLQGMLRYRAGSADEPQGKVGVASLLADAMRSAGSASYPGDEIDVWLAEQRAELTIEASLDRFEIRFACPPSAWEGMLERLATLLSAPAIDTEQIDRARQRLLAELAYQRAIPASVANWAVAVVAYGTDSPFARRPSRESLGAITLDDIDQFRRQRLRPQDVLVGVLGDPTDDQLRSLASTLAGPVEEILEDDVQATPPADVAPPEARPYAGFIQPARTRIWIVDRPNALHTEVRIAAPGVRRLDPDASALEMWSRIVGQGGRATRLGRRFPERDVSAGFRAEWSRTGLFLAEFQTPNDRVRATFEALMEHLEAAVDSISREEIQGVRQRLMNEELFAADSPPKALERTLDLAEHDYPEDYYRQRLLSWRTATPESLAEAVGERFDPTRMVIVAVGPAAALRAAFDGLGDIDELPLERTLAPGGGQPAEVEALLAAVGGRQAWSDAAAIQAQIDIVLPSREIPSRQWSELAGSRFRAEYLIAGETVVLVVDSERALQKIGAVQTSLSEEDYRAQRAAKERSLWQVLHRLARGADLRVRVDEARHLVIQDDQGLDIVIETDADGLPTRMTDRSGPEPIARDFLEWSHAGPLAFPARIVTPKDGIEWHVATLEGLTEFNPLLLELGN